MREELIARFNLPDYTPTGRRELTALTDMETGLGNFIASRFNGLMVSDTKLRRNKGLLAFIAKTPEQRVHCGQFDSVPEMLTSISAKEHRANSLPVVNVSMPAGFDIYDGEAYRDVERAGMLMRSESEAMAYINKVFVRGSATVTLVAEDKPTASAMATALATALRLYTSKGKTRFTSKTKLMGVDVELNGEIENPKMLTFDPQTLPFNESRVYALSLSLDMVVELLEAVEIKPKNVRVDVYGGVPVYE